MYIQKQIWAANFINKGGRCYKHSLFAPYIMSKALCDCLSID